MKGITKAGLQKILKTTGIKSYPYRRGVLCDKLLVIIAPYAEKGIHDVEGELDFCGTIEEALDSGSKEMLNTDERVAVCGLIYDALEFPHFWEG